MELSIYEDDLQFYFVTEMSIEKSSTDMKFAFERLLEVTKTKNNLQWITEANCLKLKGITKKFIFILEQFNGKAFDYLRTKTKALVMGYRCLVKCLLNDITVPHTQSPIYSLTLYKLVICVSGFNVAEKEEIKQLVNYMGGVYEPTLNLKTTHLITNTVMSQKYERAALNNIMIMKENWIHTIWELCQTVVSAAGDLSANEMNNEKYRVPPFYKLNITATKINKNERTKLKKHIEENGGTYCNGFKADVIDILISSADDNASDKLKAAIACRKDCLTSDWIYDSIEKGYAVAVNKYRINNRPLLEKSTPKKDQSGNAYEQFEMSNATVLSEISQNRTINDTTMLGNSICSNTTTTTSTTSINLAIGNINAKSSKDYLLAYKTLLNNIKITDVRRCGLFLDGCCIYVCGFNGEEREKLYKILNTGGATRYDDFNSNVTHVIVGSPNPIEIKQMKIQNPMTPIVTFEWIQECMTGKHLIPEDNFLYNLRTQETSFDKEQQQQQQHQQDHQQQHQQQSDCPDEPSPASKKNIDSMNCTFKKPFPKRLRFDEEAEGDVEGAEEDEAEADSTIKNLQFNSGRRNNNNKTNDSNNDKTPMNEHNDDDDADDDNNDIMNQYLMNNNNNNNKQQKPTPPIGAIPVATGNASRTNLTETEYTECTEDDDEFTDIFKNIKIKFYGFEENIIKKFNKQCQIDGATIINDNNADDDNNFNVDYLIVPINFCDYENKMKKSRYIVTELWIEDCKFAEKMVDVKYYHKPIEVPFELRPLIGLTICVSSYTGKEREYIEALVNLLGATFTNSFGRPQNTILICPTPEGAKYNAAVRWRLPAISTKWLIKCAEMKRRIPMTPFLIGVTQAPENDFDFEIIVESQQNNSNNTINLDDDDDDDDGHLLDDKKENKDCIPNSTQKSKTSSAKWAGSTSNTTPIQHKRIAAITGGSMRKIASPLLHAAESQSSPEHINNISDLVKEFPTPQRDVLYKALKEIDASETPETKRRKKAMGTPPMPVLSDKYSTPNVKQMMDSFWDKRKLEPPVEARRKSTPFSELKRKFWKEACGEAYVSPAPKWTQSYTQHEEMINSKPSATTSTLTTGAAAAAAAAAAGQSPKKATTPSDNVRKLQEFLNNRPAEVIETNYTVETETEFVPSAHGVDTEHQVAWQDPTEFQRFKHADNTNRRDAAKFVIGGTSIELKAKLTESIKLLNAQVCESSNNTSIYDRNSTHVLCETLSGMEKIYAGIAGGKWILSTKYIEDSVTAGYLLDENEYEWGNPRVNDLPMLDNRQKAIADAAYRWRQRVLNDDQFRNGAFDGFNAILLVPSAKCDSYKRLLEAGNGAVVNIKPPFSDSMDFSTVTHCISDEKTFVLSPKDMDILKKNAIICVTVKYIYNYLTLPVLPNQENYAFNK